MGFVTIRARNQMQFVDLLIPIMTQRKRSEKMRRFTTEGARIKLKLLYGSAEQLPNFYVIFNTR